MELVRVWVRALGRSKLVDVAGSNLEVLLFTPPSVPESPPESHRAYIWVQFLLVSLGV